MSKNITEDILLKAGFEETFRGFVKLNDNENIIVAEAWRYKPFFNPDREWIASVFDYRYGQITNTDIQTIEHFNKLMELIDIDFRLKEE